MVSVPYRALILYMVSWSFIVFDDLGQIIGKRVRFPRLCFRRAYDNLCDARPATADKTYLKLLQLANVQSEQQVADAIELLLEERQLPTLENVKELMDVFQQERRKVKVIQPNLVDYDRLLSSHDFTSRSH